MHVIPLLFLAIFLNTYIAIGDPNDLGVTPLQTGNIKFLRHRATEAGLVEVLQNVKGREEISFAEFDFAAELLSDKSRSPQVHKAALEVIRKQSAAELGRLIKDEPDEQKREKLATRMALLAIHSPSRGEYIWGLLIPLAFDGKVKFNHLRELPSGNFKELQQHFRLCPAERRQELAQVFCGRRRIHPRWNQWLDEVHENHEVDPPDEIVFELLEAIEMGAAFPKVITTIGRVKPDHSPEVGRLLFQIAHSRNQGLATAAGPKLSEWLSADETRTREFLFAGVQNTEFKSQQLADYAIQLLLKLPQSNTAWAIVINHFAERRFKGTDQNRVLLAMSRQAFQTNAFSHADDVTREDLVELLLAAKKKASYKEFKENVPFFIRRIVGTEEGNCSAAVTAG